MQQDISKINNATVNTSMTEFGKALAKVEM